jgi:3-oxoacyl-[acyl-carrier-protein] synthase III
MSFQTIITGFGSCLPDRVVKNDYFIDRKFYQPNGEIFPKQGKEVVDKLESITGIKERRYITDDQDSIVIALKAAERAIADAGIDKEELGGIIIGHNAGNMVPGRPFFETVPNMAALLKNALGIKSYQFFAYDILFGCPGWLQGMIQAHQSIVCGDAKHVLVMGLEVASRMLDPHDPDSLIFADGAGAIVLSENNTSNQIGIKAYQTFSHCQNDLKHIFLGSSYNQELGQGCYAKMNGRDVYRYATQYVPEVIKASLDKAGLHISDVNTFFFHQANGKMLAAIAENLCKLYGMPFADLKAKIPTTIQFLGNTSVATIPTMLDLVWRGELEGGFSINKGDIVVFASVGAGMHCNSVVYQF